MEAIDVELSDFTLRCRSLLLSHVATSLSRGLEPGEQVVLHDRVLGYYSARVADIGFDIGETLYRLQIGARLTEEEARERLLGATDPPPGRLTRSEILDLLAQLRASTRTLPAASRHRRTGAAL